MLEVSGVMALDVILVQRINQELGEDVVTFESITKDSIADNYPRPVVQWYTAQQVAQYIKEELHA